MKLRKIDRIYKFVIEPIDNIELFKHCSGGFYNVDERDFKREVVPLLHAHGINLLTYENGEIFTFQEKEKK